jgi:hypothetical protein
MSDAPGISIPRKGKDADQDMSKSFGDASRSSMDSSRGSMDAMDQMKQKDKWKLFQRRGRVWAQTKETDPATSWYSA